MKIISGKKGKKNHSGRTAAVLCAAILLTVCIVLAGCRTDGGGAGSRNPQNTSKGVDEVLAEGVEEYAGAAQSEEKNTSAAQESVADNIPEKNSGKSTETTSADVDVDLTAMSSTIVYSEVFNMMSDPDSYIGKTVRMNGSCSIYYEESTGRYYYACIIRDATACCAQGIEFELDESYSGPDDYPDEGEEIVVEGTFDTYMDGEYLYCTLRDARLIDS